MENEWKAGLERKCQPAGGHLSWDPRAERPNMEKKGADVE